MSVDELIGKKAAVFIGEFGFQLVGTSGDIDLIVDGEELACGHFRGVISVIGLDRELSGTLVEFVEDLMYGPVSKPLTK